MAVARKAATLMPGRKETTIRGLRMKAEPAYWLRRLSRFPFYFESHNASFRLNVERVALEDSADPWPDNMIEVEVVFQDETKTAIVFDVPELSVGEKARLLIDEIYVASPGQTHLRVPTKIPVGGGAFGRAEWQTVYAYKVRTEESLWVSVLSPILLISAIALGVLFQRLDAPTVQNIIEFPIPPTIGAQSTEPVSPPPERTAEDARETPEREPEVQ